MKSCEFLHTTQTIELNRIKFVNSIQLTRSTIATCDLLTRATALLNLVLHSRLMLTHGYSG